jgi:hypothetical protein
VSRVFDPVYCKKCPCGVVVCCPIVSIAYLSAVVIVYASSRAEIVAAYPACTFVTGDDGKDGELIE